MNNEEREGGGCWNERGGEKRRPLKAWLCAHAWKKWESWLISQLYQATTHYPPIAPCTPHPKFAKYNQKKESSRNALAAFKFSFEQTANCYGRSKSFSQHPSFSLSLSFSNSQTNTHTHHTNAHTLSLIGTHFLCHEVKARICIMCYMTTLLV